LRAAAAKIPAGSADVTDLLDMPKNAQFTLNIAGSDTFGRSP
jgi:hypothetical protein